jgi:N-terminal domain of toast_rack, DUF2154/Domain of unknown function (DUF5668)
MVRSQRTSLVFPILLIALGAILLYTQYHPAWDPWPILRTYWPLILIFVGLGKIWDATRSQQSGNAGRNSAANAGGSGVSVGSTIAILGFVLVLLALFWHGRTYSGGRHGDRSTHHENRTVDRQDAKSVNVSVESGAGQVTVSGGSSHLLDADFAYGYSFSSPQVNYKLEAGVGQLDITQDGERTHFGTTHNDWDLRFSNDVPMELKVNMGAGEGRFRLRDLQVTDLQLRMGAGHVDVDLTGARKKDLNVDIQGGVGQATIRLPRNVGVIANASGGIGSIAAHGLKHDGDDYVNDKYGKTPATIHLKVQGGVGEISLITED